MDRHQRLRRDLIRNSAVWKRLDAAEREDAARNEQANARGERVEQWLILGVGLFLALVLGIFLAYLVLNY